MSLSDLTVLLNMEFLCPTDRSKSTSILLIHVDWNFKLNSQITARGKHYATVISSGSIDKAFGLTFTSEMETCSVVEELNRTLVRLSLAVPPDVPLLVKTASGLLFFMEATSGCTEHMRRV